MEGKKSSMQELRIEVPAPRKKGIKTVKMTEKRQEKLRNILDEMKTDLERIDRIRERVKREKISFFTPQQNKKMIEEIEVPVLKMFRETKKES